MIRRYFLSADGGSPTPPTGVMFGTVVKISESTTTVTQKTNVVGGVSGATVVFRITAYRASDPANQYFNVVGYGTFIGTQTFSAILDASGNFSFTTIVYGGTHSPGGIFVTVSIDSTTSGGIGSPATQSYSKTI